MGLSNETQRMQHQFHPTSYADAVDVLGNLDRRKIANNTYLERLPSGRIGVRLHNTIVVRFFLSGAMDLFSGGYRTVTTKERINRYLPTGYGVFSKAHVWKIQGPDGIAQDFNEGVMIQPYAVTS